MNTPALNPHALTLPRALTTLLAGVLFGLGLSVATMVQPEVVLGGSSATTPGEFAAPWVRNQAYAGLRQVRAMYVDPDYIQRQTPRILQGAQAVCEHLEAVRTARTVGTK